MKKAHIIYTFTDKSRLVVVAVVLVFVVVVVVVVVVMVIFRVSRFLFIRLFVCLILGTYIVI